MWSGFMKSIFRKLQQETQKTSIIFKPIIDMPPTDIQCVYSTLKVIQVISAKYNRTPVCTFHQALWWKALQVINAPHSDMSNIVIRLGGFHTLMSFLGSVGYIMANSGLDAVLQIPYTTNTVPHLMSGKAVNRALRGHQIVDLALNTLLLQAS